MRKLILSIVLIVMTASPTAAQTTFERVLLPVTIEFQLPGAYGSLWESPLVLLNDGPTPIEVQGIPTSCRLGAGCTDPQILGPGATITTRTGLEPPAGQGKFLHVEKGRAADLNVLLRVHDISRQTKTWGTVVPTVHESEALTETSQLLDIGLTPESRALLRVYDFDPAPGRVVRLRLFRVDPTRSTTDQQVQDQLLGDVFLTFDARLDENPPGRTFYPGYAAVMLSDLPVLATTQRLRVEVIPETAGLRYWAFVSVTNNETQHVTIMPPQ